MIGHGEIKITGELTTQAKITNTEIMDCVKQVLEDNRYEWDNFSVETNIVKQSPYIAQ
jgi:S-adenosylmethionine synthetase